MFSTGHSLQRVWTLPLSIDTHSTRFTPTENLELPFYDFLKIPSPINKGRDGGRGSCNAGLTSLSALLLFPLLITFFIFMPLCTVFYSISSNIDKVLLINPSAYLFVFGYFKVGLSPSKKLFFICFKAFFIIFEGLS